MMPNLQQILVQYTRLRDQGMEMRSALDAMRDTLDTLSHDDRLELAHQIRVQEVAQTQPGDMTTTRRVVMPKTEATSLSSTDQVACPHCGKYNRAGEVVCYSCGNVMSMGESEYRTHVFTNPLRGAEGDDYFGADSVLILTARINQRQYEIRPQNMDREIVLGRASSRSPMSPDIDLSDSDANRLGVSRQHLSIHYDTQYNTLTVFDLGSANGTLINGQRLHPHEVRVLHHNDELRLGNMLLFVTFQHDAPV